MIKNIFCAALLSLFFLGCEKVQHHTFHEKGPHAKTTSVSGKAGEVALWQDRSDPSKGVIIGSDKSALGALYIYNLQGKQIGRSGRLNRPVGVSVRYDVSLHSGEKIDVVACAMRSTNEIKIFKVDSNTQKLIDITTPKGITSGFENNTCGVCLYRRPSDGQLFAFLSRGKTDNIHQIQLSDDGTGKIGGALVRKFGKGEQKSRIGGMVADDERGYLYCSDERNAILKYRADPNTQGDPFIQRFGTKDDIVGGREGLAIYHKPEGEGYLIVSSSGDSTFKIYRREGTNKFIKSISIDGVRNSNGIATTACPASPHYPTGIFALHNSTDNNYIIFDWYTCTKLK